MLNWIKSHLPVVAIAALVGMPAGCAGGIVQTQTQPAIERLYDAADGPLEEAEATIGLYYEAAATAELLCFDVPAAQRAPLATCEGVAATLNASQGAARIALEALADAEAARLIYEDYNTARGEEGLLAAQAAAIDATGLAISVWTRTRPRVLDALETIGKVSPPADPAPVTVTPN